jgi:hypothetical protein
MKYAWLLLLVLACSGEGNGTRTPAAPSAATALAQTFAPELVGNLVPITPRAGDYAMALTMKFQTYPSMEMLTSEVRTGALRMTLAGDGTAYACLGSRSIRTDVGDYYYQPPERRRPGTLEENVQLAALAGQWNVIDGIATIQFDRLSRGTCDLANATRMHQPLAQLRCIGVGPTDRVPASSLACEASEQSPLLALGMPMTTASRNVPTSPIHPTPEGPNLLLGAPGLVVNVGQDSRDMIPTITFRAGVVTFVESDYRRSK